MSMIKRGHSDTSRPSVISSSKKCTKCGYSDRSSSVCPKCNERMIDILSEVTNNCKDGICRLE